jgi:hypothetical protein
MLATFQDEFASIPIACARDNARDSSSGASFSGASQWEGLNKPNTSSSPTVLGGATSRSVTSTFVVAISICTSVCEIAFR